MFPENGSVGHSRSRVSAKVLLTLFVRNHPHFLVLQVSEHKKVISFCHRSVAARSLVVRSDSFHSITPTREDIYDEDDRCHVCRRHRGAPFWLRGAAREAAGELMAVLQGAPPPWLAKVLGKEPLERARFEMDELE